MTEVATHAPPPNELATADDPTGGRLVAWARAAQAAHSLAKALATTTFVPKEMRDVSNATAAILAGDEVGLSPIASLRSIYVVHGTPAFYARTMVALAQSQGHEIWTSESTDSKVTVHGRRKGTDNVETSTWTIQRAQKAKYTSNAKYASNPQEMLYAKAATEVARKVAADVLMGLPYSVEDLELDEAPTTTVTRSTATTRVARKAKPAEPAAEAQGPAQEGQEPPPAPPEGQTITEAITGPSKEQMNLMFALLGEAGLKDREPALRYVSSVVDREIESRNDLSADEVSRTIDALQAENKTTPANTDDAAYEWAGQEADQ